MRVEKKRIFIGNLPLKTNEAELKKKCEKYGEVLSVELKQRHESSRFAFVDLNINSGNLNACFEALRQREWKGHSVTVELAKESFLSRLAREREQQHQEHTATPTAGAGGGSCEEVGVVAEEGHVLGKSGLPMFRGTVLALHRAEGEATKEALVRQPVHGKDEVAPKSDLQHRLTNFSDTWRDDVHPGTGSQQGIAEKPLRFHQKQTDHLDSNNKTVDKKLEPERFTLSEQKRLKSLEEKRRIFNEQKKVIQSALASVDNKQTLNKRVVFNSDDDSDDNGNGQEATELPVSSRTTLFDDDSADEKLTINHHFEGEKGRKLMELQSRYGNDERFRLDERFRDDEEDNDEENEHFSEQEDDERMQNLKILSSVLGQEVLPAEKIRHKHRGKPMLRFDPTKPDHEKYEIKKNTTTSTTANEMTKKKIATELNSQPSVKVSKEKFYKVSETLKESFQKDGIETFSLRKMFSADDDEGRESSDSEPSAEVDSESNKQVGSQNPLRDTPGGQVEDGGGGDSKEARSAPTSAQQPSKRDVQLVQGNTFFFLPDDLRLSEGVEFFNKKSSSTKRSENFAEYRKELKRWAKKKMKNNKVVVKKKRNVKQKNVSQKRHAKKFKS